MRFLLKYVTRPLHFFGPIGFCSLAAGAIAGGWIAGTKLITGAPVFLEHGPLLLLSAVLIQTGTMLIGIGLLAELVTRIYTVSAAQRRLARPVPVRPAVRQRRAGESQQRP